MKAQDWLISLGRITANAQVFELQSCLVLGACLGLENDVALRLGPRLPTLRRLALIEELADSNHYQQLDPTDVLAFVKAARKANEDRDRAIHRAWSGDPETGEITHVLAKGGFEPGTQSDLEKAVKSLHDATAASAKLLNLEGGSGSMKIEL